MPKCKTCKDGYHELLAKNEELHSKGNEFVRNPPGRSRNFEAMKMVQREFDGLSGRDAQKAKKEFFRVMKNMEDYKQTR